MSCAAVPTLVSLRHGATEASPACEGHPPPPLASVLWHRVRCLDARITALESRILFSIASHRAFLHAGFASMADFSREMLGIPARTARRRVALHRLLESSSLIRNAFLGGDLTPCQALALRPVAESGDLPRWVAVARGLGVRELRKRIREAGKDPSDNQETGDIRVTVSVPPVVVVALDQALELARKTLGWNAPRHECIRAMLEEASSVLEVDPQPELRSEGSLRSLGVPESFSRPDGPARAPRGFRWLDVSGSPSGKTSPAGNRLRRILEEFEELAGLVLGEARDVRQIEGAKGPGERAHLEAALHRLDLMKRHRRVLRLLQTELLLAFQDLEWEASHQSTWASVADRAGVSPRAARLLRAEHAILEDEPRLRSAYLRGQIGITHAFLIHRVANGRNLDALLDRAQSVTVRQFEREVRILERVAGLGLRTDPGGSAPRLHCDTFLELVAHLRRSGVLDASLEDGDPAENPRLMTGVEEAVDRLALASYPDPADIGSRVESDVRRTLATEPERVSFSFWAPDGLFSFWQSILDAIRSQTGPVPQWVALVLLIEHAVSSWESPDPSRRPREHRILARDGYRCAAPGCTRRRHLEVHHIQYRSRGGGNHPSNKITLCAWHHHQGIHGDAVRLRGEAPGSLNWTLGVKTNRVVRFLGDRRV